MTAIESAQSFRSFAAPRGDGQALIEPSIPQLPELLAANRDRIDRWDWSHGELSIDRLRTEARRDLIDAARRYTRAYRDVDLPGGDEVPVVMAGHQPELFHPGVWFKNFVLSRLASDASAIAVNLVVDHDLVGPPAFRVPTRSVTSAASAQGRNAAGLGGDSLVREAIPYDQPAAQAIPFEQRWIGNREIFDRFPDRVVKALAGLIEDPCVVPLWRHAREAADRCANVGCSIAQARHALEGDLGLQTLELPLSVLCRAPAFSRFVLGLLNELPQFQDAYNDSLLQYRAAHGIRSKAHPVPELRQEEGWLEAPLWLYGDDDPVRRPVWVRLRDDELQVSDRHQRTLRIDAKRSVADAALQLHEAAGPNWKLRPRALLTTMYARLVASDLFLHGIGGAKYDQLNDQIIRRFFGVEPPHYGVISATVWIPQPTSDRLQTSPADVEVLLRETRYSPERFAGEGIPAMLLERKQQLLDNIPTVGSKADWHRQIETVNAEMSRYLEPLRNRLGGQLREAREEQRQQQIWTSREHPFAIYSLDHLQTSFSGMLDQ